MPSSGQSVVVGLSGGVDSAVTAWLLKQQGYSVQGLFMQNWVEDDSGYCSAAQDFQDARAVAEEIGIPLHRVDFSAEYQNRVFSEFIAQLKAGKTPNPDVLCNREIKFQPFVEHARRLGAEFVATGHYAQIQQLADGPHLLRAADENKDQTYFLAGVARSHLNKVLFPIGGLSKPQVRELASQAGLPNHKKRDSTGICFIGERPFSEFLAEHIPHNPGVICSDTGSELGSHSGLHFHTLGQRKGLKIGGVSGADTAPWYVIKKDFANNILVVAQNREHPYLMHQQALTEPFHWINRPAATHFSALARLRHRQTLVPCEVRMQDNGGVCAEFATEQRAVVAGQFLALYLDQECLGCGEMRAAQP